MDKHETIADVLAAMRDEWRTGESSCLEWVGAKMRHYADRFEAAHKREVLESVTVSNQLREALMNLDKWLFVGVDGYVHGQPDKTVEIELTIKEALAATATTSIQNTQEDT